MALRSLARFALSRRVADACFQQVGQDALCRLTSRLN